ncbi:MAG: hypothetical protein ACR2OZ_11690 [Verrucomicrobiales bacterium]
MAETTRQPRRYSHRHAVLFYVGQLKGEFPNSSEDVISAAVERAIQEIHEGGDSETVMRRARHLLH